MNRERRSPRDASALRPSPLPTPLSHLETVVSALKVVDARTALDYPDFTDDIDPERARAMWQASAVADGAMALVELLEDNREDFLSSVASALDFAIRASPGGGERKWQSDRLVRLLLKL